MAESFRGKSLVMILLEVILISGGVFLGLLAEQWRERSSERELATIALSRLRTEVAANRNSVAAAMPYHVRVRDDMTKYFRAPDGGKSWEVEMERDVWPVFFQRTAWDMTQASGAMAHIDSDLVFALSSVYTLQEDYTALQRALLQGTIYGRSWTQDFDGYWRSVRSFLGDASFFEPTLMKAYDSALPMIDEALRQ